MPVGYAILHRSISATAAAAAACMLLYVQCDGFNAAGLCTQPVEVHSL